MHIHHFVLHLVLIKNNKGFRKAEITFLFLKKYFVISNVFHGPQALSLCLFEASNIGVIASNDVPEPAACPFTITQPVTS